MHYYKEPWPFIGAKSIGRRWKRIQAVDAALECWRKGAEVRHGSCLDDEVNQNVKYLGCVLYHDRIKEGSIYGKLSQSKVKDPSNRSDNFLTPEGKFTIANEFVLAMTGLQTKILVYMTNSVL